MGNAFRAAIVASAALVAVSAQGQNTTVTTRVFYPNGLLYSESIDGVTTYRDYWPTGDLKTFTHPNGHSDVYFDYLRGTAQRVEEREGIVTSSRVDNLGRVYSRTDGENNTETFDFDIMDRLTGGTFAKEGTHPFVVSYQPYGTSAPEVHTLTRGPFREARTYDGFGRLVEIDHGGLLTTLRYDDAGRLHFKSNPYKRGDEVKGQTYYYDELDRIRRIVRADNNEVKYSYGASSDGRPQIEETNERGHVTKKVQRAFGAPDETALVRLEFANPDGSLERTIPIERNVRGQITKVQTGGVTRLYGYNEHFYLDSVDEPETGLTKYVRDLSGNMKFSRVGASAETKYGYDNRNRLKSIEYPDGRKVSKTYHKTDRLWTVTAEDSNVTVGRVLGYDKNLNITEDRFSVHYPARPSEGFLASVVYTFDANDYYSAITYPYSGRTVEYAPDALGWPTKVTGYAELLEHWPNGHLKTIRYANGVVSEYGQDERLMMKAFRTTRGSSVYYDSAFVYDPALNLKTVTDTVLPSSRNRSFAYNNHNELTGADGWWGTGSIVYDKLGNIRSQRLGSQEIVYGYDTKNRLSQTTGSWAGTYRYDVYGNVTSNSLSDFVYDAASNLVCANCNDSAKKKEYTYDGLGHRGVIAKSGSRTFEFRDQKGLLVFDHVRETGDVVEYIYLGGKRIAQRAFKL
jgi:hypothetical protein